MKIVTLEELGDYPPGTIFYETDPHCVGPEMYRLGEIIRHPHTEWDPATRTMKSLGPDRVRDFYYMDLMPSYNDNAFSKLPRDEQDTNAGMSKILEICDGWARWGCFKDDQLFIVLEEEDVKRLVYCLTASPEELKFPR
jgi:hypothetical protein